MEYWKFFSNLGIRQRFLLEPLPFNIVLEVSIQKSGNEVQLSLFTFNAESSMESTTMLLVLVTEFKGSIQKSVLLLYNSNDQEEFGIKNGNCFQWYQKIWNG